MLEETGLENPLRKFINNNNDKMRIMSPMKNQNNINPMMGLRMINNNNNNMNEMMNPMNNNNMDNMGGMNIMNMMMNQMNENRMNNIGGIKNMNCNSMNENMMNNMGGINMGNMMMNQMNGNSDNNIGMKQSSNFNMNSLAGSSMFLDENTKRIKEIIEPYENKIKKHEETIRKLNFQLTVLKDKLKHSNNQQQLIGNSMSSINNSMENNVDDDIININFEYGNEVQKIKCLKDELVMSIINKFCKRNNLNQDSLLFYFQNKIIPNYMTASEIGLGNNFSIFVQNNINSSLNRFENQNNTVFPPKINFGLNNNNLNNLNMVEFNTERKINLIFNYKDKKVVILLGENSPVGDGLRAFLEKENINKNEYKGFTFVYDGINISLTDQRRPNEVFKGLNPQIKVFV
jgi:hypothetical protein